MTVAIKIETPARTAPTFWDGLITQVYDATVTRSTNHAGSFSVSVPMSANQAAQVRHGWRISILDERPGEVDSAGDPFEPPHVLLGGIVRGRSPTVSEDGSIRLTLNGETFLGSLADYYLQEGSNYNSATLDFILASLLTPLGISYRVPIRCTFDTVSIEIADETLLSALYRLAELTRTNLVDTWVEEVCFFDQNDIKDPETNVNVDDDTLRVVNMERLTPDTKNAALGGFAVVSEPPDLTYNSDELANKLKVIGVDFDGSDLTLQGASGGNYTVQSAAGPLGNYYFVADSASIAKYGTVETQVVRSDFRNPNDDAVSREATRAGLLAIACGELVRRRSEFFTASFALANGRDIWVLPGERITVRYKGKAYLQDGRIVTNVDIDRILLVVRRYDTIQENGVRLVKIDASSPELTYENPTLPAVTSMPTPRDTQLPKEPKDAKKPDAPKKEDFVPIDPALVQQLMDQMKGTGAYEPCCAPPTKVPPAIGDIPNGFPMPIPVRDCYVPFVSSAVQDFRFVEKWGEGWADPGLGGIDGAIHPDTDRAVVVLVSSSADPVLVVSGASPQLLAAIDTNSPANFGGDGHTWWRFYYLVPTADLIDFAGTTGVTRNVTFFRANAVLVDRPMVIETTHTPGSGTIADTQHQRPANFIEVGVVDAVDYQFSSDLQYHGSSFGEAIEEASANQNSIFGDAVWMYVSTVYRSIDTITFDKTFHHEDTAAFDHDYSLFNAEFVTLTPGGGAASQTDWMLADPVNDGYGSHEMSIRFRGDAVASDFPGACRILVLVASIKLRALCETHLID